MEGVHDGVGAVSVEGLRTERKTAHELSAGIVNLGTSRMGTVTAGCLEQDKVETVAVW